MAAPAAGTGSARKAVVLGEGEVSGALLREFAAVVGDAHVLTGDATAGYTVDWTGRVRGHAPAVLRPGPMRAQVRGVQAVLADGTVVSHLAGLVKDNTGYDYPGLLAGSEGTLAVVTAARIQLVHRAADPVTVIIGLDGPGEVHAVAREALRTVPGLLSAEFFTRAGLDVLAEHAGLAPPLREPVPAFLLLEAAGPGADEDLARVAGGHPGAAWTT